MLKIIETSSYRQKKAAGRFRRFYGTIHISVFVPEPDPNMFMDESGEDNHQAYESAYNIFQSQLKEIAKESVEQASNLISGKQIEVYRQGMDVMYPNIKVQETEAFDENLKPI